MYTEGLIASTYQAISQKKSMIKSFTLKLKCSQQISNSWISCLVHLYNGLTFLDFFVRGGSHRSLLYFNANYKVRKNTLKRNRSKEMENRCADKMAPFSCFMSMDYRFLLSPFNFPLLIFGYRSPHTFYSELKHNVAPVNCDQAMNSDELQQDSTLHTQKAWSLGGEENKSGEVISTCFVWWSRAADVYQTASPFTGNLSTQVSFLFAHIFPLLSFPHGLIAKTVEPLNSIATKMNFLCTLTLGIMVIQKSLD